MTTKRLAQFIGAILAQPARLRFAVLRKIIGDDQAFSNISESLARRPGLMGNYQRQAFYRSALARTGRDIHFGYQTLLSKPAAELGDRVYLGRFCTLGWVIIDNDAKLADGVQVLSGARHHQHDNNLNLAEAPVRLRPVHIGKGAWIGANAVVMADVGDGAIVGAGAVVTRPVEAHTTVAGVPARVISSQPEQRAA